MKSIKNLTLYNKLFGILILFHTVIYFVFRHLYTAAQTFDSAGHIALAFKFGHLFSDFFNGGEATIYDILTTSFYYPPLMHWVGGVLTLVFGKNIDLMLYLVFFSFLGCVFLIKKIVLELGFGGKPAFFSAFFYSFFPFVADQARLFHTDIPMTFFLLLSLLFLIKSQLFSKSKYVYLFFISAGLGMLIRWFVPFYLAVPVLYVLYASLVKQRSYGRVLPKLLVGSVIFLVICLPWYVANFELLRIVSSFFAQGEKDDPQIFLSLENFTFYLKNIVGFQILIVPFVLSLWGTVRLYKVNKSAALLLILEIVLVYAVFTIVKNKNSRYVLGLLPVFGFLCAYSVSLINNKVVKVLVVLFCVTGLMYTSFNRATARSIESRAWGALLGGPFYDNLYIYPFVFSYRESAVDVGELLTDIYFQAGNAQIRPVGVVSSVDSEAVSAANLELTRAYLGYEDMYFATPYFRERAFESDYNLIKYLRDRGASFVLDANYAGPDNHRHYGILVQMGEFARSQGSYWFDKTTVYNYAGNEIRVLKRKNFNPDFPVDTCKMMGTKDGSLTLQADPLASMVVFASSFEYNGHFRAYEPGTTRILELNNFETVTKQYIINNLPLSVSVCHRLGTQIKLMKEISQTFLSKDSKCGQGTCSNLVHAKIGIESTLEEKRYSKEDFEGFGFAKTLKKAKIYPYYYEIYSVKQDIIDELVTNGTK